MRKVARDQDVALLSTQPLCNPLRRIVGLEIPRRTKLGQGVTGAPQRLGGLLRAQLAAVPDNGGPGAASGRLRREPFDVGAAVDRQRPLRVDVRSDGVAVMDEINDQRSSLKAQLSRLKAQGSTFSTLKAEVSRYLKISCVEP